MRGDRQRLWPVLSVAILLSSCGGGRDVTGGAPPPVTATCAASPVIARWTKVTDAAAWSPRDSAAEFSLAGQLWIMGGWEDSFKKTPRDVWSSVDGFSWRRQVEEAPWTHGDLPATTVHDDRMWLVGGWADGRLPSASATNEVWSSAEGVYWQRHPPAPWSARLGGAAASFKGSLWLAGGVTDFHNGTADSLRNDVWRTARGDSWTLVTADAPWSPRAYHQLVAHGGRLYLLGGGNYAPGYQARNDVWSTEDGVAWRLDTESAPWSPRIWFSAVSYRGYLWVLGGFSDGPYRNWGDVWYSRDGRHWARYETDAQWSPRHEHSTVIHADQIWVAGGLAERGVLVNDVWRLALPADWLGGCDAQASP